MCLYVHVLGIVKSKLRERYLKHKVNNQQIKPTQKQGKCQKLCYTK